MSKSVMATILGGIGMVCGTVVGCFYISRKDNVKLIDKVFDYLIIKSETFFTGESFSADFN